MILSFDLIDYLFPPKDKKWGAIFQLLPFLF